MCPQHDRVVVLSQRPQRGEQSQEAHDRQADGGPTFDQQQSQIKHMHGLAHGTLAGHDGIGALCAVTEQQAFAGMIEGHLSQMGSVVNRRVGIGKAEFHDGIELVHQFGQAGSAIEHEQSDDARRDQPAQHASFLWFAPEEVKQQTGHGQDRRLRHRAGDATQQQQQQHNPQRRLPHCWEKQKTRRQRHRQRVALQHQTSRAAAVFVVDDFLSRQRLHIAGELPHRDDATQTAGDQQQVGNPLRRQIHECAPAKRNQEAPQVNHLQNRN